MDSSADSPSPSTSFNNRDWFFPSQSFFNSSQFRRTPVRRFSSPYPKPSVFQHQQTSPPQKSSSTDHHQQQKQHYYPKYASLRRRPSNFFRNENSTAAGVSGAGGSGDPGINRRPDDALAELTDGNKASTTKKGVAGSFLGRLTIRWQTAFPIAVSWLLSYSNNTFFP